jgi:multisubunit Na+/H+ antiporter MnhB subunit
MEIKVTKQEIRKDNFLTKLSLILLGILLTSSIFAFATQLSPDRGLWIALVIAILLVFIGFYYIDRGTRLRLVTWSMLVTLVMGAALFIVGVQLISQALEGL